MDEPVKTLKCDASKSGFWTAAIPQGRDRFHSADMSAHSKRYNGSTLYPEGFRGSCFHAKQ